jgi:hypothetical protein
MEFIMVFAILSILFVIWLFIYIDFNQEAFIERDKKAILDLGKSIQKQMFATSKARPGFHSTITLPEKAGNVDYDIVFSDYVFTITAKGSDYVFHIPYTIYDLDYVYGKIGSKDPINIWNVDEVVAVIVKT